MHSRTQAVCSPGRYIRTASTSRARDERENRIGCRVKLLTIGLGLGAIIAFASLTNADPWPQGPRNGNHPPVFDGQTRAPALRSDFALRTEAFAGPLQHPWGIAALPGGGFLVTERPGRMRHVDANGVLSDPIEGLPEVLAREQGGLLDVLAAPDFSQTRMVYWTYTRPHRTVLSATAAARGRLSEDFARLTEVETIFVQDPPSPLPYHFGGRIVFSGDGHLFITTGERGSENSSWRAQRLDNTYGKVIRINPDASVPTDNPFVNRDGLDEIWSYGHRNPQGAAIEPATGRLWTIEHGPAGGDELNAPDAGQNYGWPRVTYGVNYDGTPIGSGNASGPGIAEPRYFWDPVIAPSGMTFYNGELFNGWDGDLLIASLNPGALVRLKIEDMTVAGEERFLEGEHRLRDVEIGEDGSIYVLWDDRQGAILRLSPN